MIIFLIIAKFEEERYKFNKMLDAVQKSPPSNQNFFIDVYVSLYEHFDKVTLSKWLLNY